MMTAAVTAAMIPDSILGMADPQRMVRIAIWEQNAITPII